MPVGTYWHGRIPLQALTRDLVQKQKKDKADFTFGLATALQCHSNFMPLSRNLFPIGNGKYGLAEKDTGNTVWLKTKIK